MDDSENIQLRAHLKSFTKVLRILLHMVRVDGAHINIEILLGLEHIKEDVKLKAFPERTVDQSGFLVYLIRVAARPCPELLCIHLRQGFARWLWLDDKLLLELRWRWSS